MKTSAYIPKTKTDMQYIQNENNNNINNIINNQNYESQSICNICGGSIDCSKCLEYNELLQTSNYSNVINNYKLQLYNKDKTIMNYTKQISEQNKKFEMMENSLKIKDNQIINLEKNLKELKILVDNYNKENKENNELLEKYKYQIESQTQQSEHNQTIYDNNFRNMSIRLEENKTKINELEEINNKLNGDLNLLQKEIFSKNEIIENKNILNKKLSNENKNINILNKKLNEDEKNMKIINEEKMSLKQYNIELITENKKLNEKLNQVLQDLNKKENNFSVEIYNINSKLNEVEKELNNNINELNKNKKEKEAIIQNQEKYYNFVNEKLNELNEFIINKAFNNNNSDINELTQELKKINLINENNKSELYVNDIKYELIENGIFEIKKNIIKYIISSIEKNEQYINEYNLISRDNDILKAHNNEIINELNENKLIQNEIENKNKEITINYEKLKESYSKLYNDYNIFTNSNTKYVNDIQQFFLELIDDINKIFGINNKNNIAENDLNSLKEILKKKIIMLIKEYEIMNLKVKENEKRDEITYQKILEMEKLLDESHNVSKMFEEENKELKQEIDRLNYRYNLLKASIDTVENQIKVCDY